MAKRKKQKHSMRREKKNARRRKRWTAETEGGKKTEEVKRGEKNQVCKKSREKQNGEGALGETHKTTLYTSERLSWE